MIHALIVLALVSQQPNTAAPSQRLVVTGTVLDDGNKPIEHAKVYLSKKSEDDGRERVVARGETDAEGRFRVETDYRFAVSDGAKSLPVSLWSVTPKNRLLARSLSNTGSLKSKEEILRYSDDVESRFIVLGPDRQPVNRALTAPATLRIEGEIQEIPRELADMLVSECDHEGGATIRGVEASSLDTIRVDSKAFGRQFAPKAKDGKSIVLRPVGSLRGRLIATDRSIVEGETVVVIVRGNESKASFPIGEADVLTDAQGRFEVPAIVAGETTIELRANDRDRRLLVLEDRQNPIMIPQGGAVEVNLAIYDQADEKKSGRIVDREGEPVADAEVFTRGDTVATITTKSDRDGRFTLKGVPRSRFFVFAKKQGYRFVGVIVLKNDKNIDIKIIKNDENPIAPMKTLDPPISKAERIELARKTLKPVVERLIKTGDESGAVRPLLALARVDPERAIELVDENLLKNKSNRDKLIRFASIYRAKDSIEDALLFADRIESFELRIGTINQIILRIPANDKQGILNILMREIVFAKNAEDPIDRVIYQGRFAERLFEIGEVDLATKLLRKVVEDARRLPIAGRSGTARRMFAESLCRIDLPEALDLIKDLPDERDLNSGRGNIAYKLAGRSPKDSERVLSMLKNDRSRDDYACRVCYRMASIDLPRGRKIAASIGDDTLRGYAFGLIAEKLAETDKREARELLNAAFDTLERRADAGYEERFKLITPAIIDASLLPVVEKIDPALVSEYFWRSISCRYPIEHRKHHEINQAWDRWREFNLATLLSRYDRAIARSLIDSFESDSIGDSHFYYAVAAIDPNRAFDLFEKIDESAGPRLRNLKNLLRIVLGESFAREGEEYWRYVRGVVLHLWIPDFTGYE